MQYLNAARQPLNEKEYRNRSATEQDCSQTITDSTTVTLDGRVVAVYIAGLQDSAVKMIRSAVQQVNCIKDIRTNGLVTNSRIFGYAPRNELRKHPCRAVSLSTEQPKLHSIIAAGSDVAARHYAESMPDVYAVHEAAAAEKVKAEYRLGSTLFTSGIINRNNPLQYHYDSGNFDNCCSAMLGFKRDVEGGRLCIPELDIKFEISDCSLLLFDGQGFLHGVTPIKLMTKEAMRFTVVYYSLRQMWNCSAHSEELTRMRAKRVEIERRAHSATVRSDKQLKQFAAMKQSRIARKAKPDVS